MKKFIAILSTTVLPLDGTYIVKTLAKGDILDLTGIPHFIGHPDTKAIVESLGAVQSPTKLFVGLQPGERAVCFPIIQGLSSRATEGFTNPHQAVDLEALSIRTIYRYDCPRWGLFKGENSCLDCVGHDCLKSHKSKSEAHMAIEKWVRKRGGDAKDAATAIEESGIIL